MLHNISLWLFNLDVRMIMDTYLMVIKTVVNWGREYGQVLWKIWFVSLQKANGMSVDEICSLCFWNFFQEGRGWWNKEEVWERERLREYLYFHFILFWVEENVEHMNDWVNVHKPQVITPLKNGLLWLLLVSYPLPFSLCLSLSFMFCVEYSNSSCCSRAVSWQKLGTPLPHIHNSISPSS